MTRKVVARRVCVGTLLTALTLFGVGLLMPQGAGAAPSHARNALAGTFDCGNSGTGTFVVNSGNAQGTTWNVAHLTFDDGSHGIFSPTTFDLTFSFDGQSMQQQASKHPKAGQVTCSISAVQGDFSLSGTVTGTITVTGN